MVTAPQTLNLLENFADTFSTAYARKELERMSTIHFGVNQDPEKAKDPGQHVIKPDTLGFGATLSMIENISKAEAYFCSSEMSPLVEHAASVMDSTDVIDLSLVPSDYGFCYFESGIRTSDMVIIHAFAWAKVDRKLNGRDAYVFYAFNDINNEPDGIAKKRMELYEMRNPGKPYHSPYGQWLFSSVDFYIDAEGVSLDTGDKTSEELAFSANPDAYIKLDVNHNAMYHALFLLMQQERIVDNSERATSVNKKRVARMKKKSLSTDVTVVRLRRARYTDPGSGTGGFEYSVRWFVSGHWRWQPYKNDDGVSDFKRIFISPYIKGPDDKPLKISQRVVAIVK